jgi:hypothetical protein
MRPLISLLFLLSACVETREPPGKVEGAAPPCALPDTLPSDVGTRVRDLLDEASAIAALDDQEGVRYALRLFGGADSWSGTAYDDGRVTVVDEVDSQVRSFVQGWPGVADVWVEAPLSPASLVLEDEARTVTYTRDPFRRWASADGGWVGEVDEGLVILRSGIETELDTEGAVSVTDDVVALELAFPAWDVAVEASGPIASVVGTVRVAGEQWARLEARELIVTATCASEVPECGPTARCAEIR